MPDYNYLRKETPALMRLAAPVCLSQLALLGIGITDVILAGRVGTTDLAGVTLGSNAWHIVIFFFAGIAIANQPLVANFFGAGNTKALRNQIFQSAWMALGCGVTATICVLIAAQLMSLLHVTPEVLAIGTGYMTVMALGAIAMTLLMVLRTSLEAMNQTRVVFVINLSMFLLNIPLDLALLFGLWGFPELGGVGCAWASVTVLWTSVLLQWLVLVFARNNQYLKLGSSLPSPNRIQIVDTLKLGIPIGFSSLVELGFFGGAAIVIATIGEIAVASHAVAISAASVTYMLFLGLGQGISILAAQRLGARKPHRSITGIWFGINLSLVLATVLSIIIVTFRFEIAGLYSKDINVINLAAQLLIWAAIFQLADALQITAICGLRAFKETRSPPRYQLIAFWLLAFPLGYGLGVLGWIPVLQGPQGFWLAMLIGLSVAAILITRKLWHVAQAVKTRKYNPYAAQAKL